MGGGHAQGHGCDMVLELEVYAHWSTIQIKWCCMAAREDLAVIREARAGFLPAQLELGKRYLEGSGGLPRSIDTAWHWFKRAALQESMDACILIGQNIPYELAAKENSLSSVCSWYERAFDAGVKEAGLVFAKLMLTQNSQPLDETSQNKVYGALSAAAKEGIAEAQWLLAQGLAESKQSGKALALKWTTRAAMNGVQLAQYILAEQSWEQGDRTAFLRWALPLARSLTEHSLVSEPKIERDKSVGCNLTDQQVRLLSNCAVVLSELPGSDGDEIQRYWVLAAHGFDKQAQLNLGLWFAKIDTDGKTVLIGPTVPDYKRAIYWLTLSGKQGSSIAWYAMSRIYLKVGFSQRSLKDARQCCQKAAELGHRRAQFECGATAWRSRHQCAANEVRSVYWLQKAVAQGCQDSANLLKKIAIPAQPAPWAQAALGELSPSYLNRNRFVAARIELAAWFGLSRAEALLIDLAVADKGFCIEVDLHKYRRGKRRLILLQTSQQRQALTRIAEVPADFNIDGAGLEHAIRNHLQYLYRVGRKKISDDAQSTCLERSST